jgi:hypothetical protein
MSELTKQELAELVYTKSELNRVDFAIPQEIADRLRETGVVKGGFYYVMDYNNSLAFGELVHLGEKFIQKYEGLLMDLHDINSAEKPELPRPDESEQIIEAMCDCDECSLTQHNVDHFYAMMKKVAYEMREDDMPDNDMGRS